MILKFATKRDVNGNRKYIAIDFRYSEYSTNPAKWYCKENTIEIKTSDLHKLREQCNEQHFNEIESL